MTVWTSVRMRAIVGLVAAALFASAGAAAPASATSGLVKASSIKSAVAPAKDASLKSLAVTAPKAVSLKPKFKPALLKYTAIVPAGTTKVAFKAVTTQKAAKVAIKPPKAYKPGANKVTLTVTAPDKKTKLVYTVTVMVLMAPTVTIDNASLVVEPGGFSVKVKVLNATISTVITKDTTPACQAADPYAFASAPSTDGVIKIKVEGGVKGCALSLSLNVTPKKGYSVIKVTPLKVTPIKDAIGFNQKPYVGTANGFTVDYTVINATVVCTPKSKPDSAAFMQTATQLIVTGLSAGPPAQSATITCAFTPKPNDGSIDPVPAVDITGFPLQQSAMAVGDPVKTSDGFYVNVLALGCTPSAAITDPVGVGDVDVSDPIRSSYKITVTGLTESQQATINLTCAGRPGQFTDADAVQVTGQAATATELGLITAPRIADATDAGDGTLTEDMLPDLTPGVQPAILYATTPEWDPWDASGKNTFQWQASASEYDADGLACTDSKSTVTWGDLIADPKKDRWWDPKFQHLLYLGDLLTSRGELMGRCVRVKATGTLGKRTATVFSPPVAIPSAYPPQVCALLPQISGASSDTYTVSGDVLTSTIGQCTHANGLDVTVEWQTSTVTSPSADSDWTTMVTVGANITVSSAMNNMWLRSKVTYTAQQGSVSVYSARLAVAGGSLPPVNNSAPVLSCVAGTSCIGLSQSALTLTSLGNWNRAAGADLTITWQYSVDESPDSWVDQVALDKDGNALQASLTFTVPATNGFYRAAVTFASQTASYDSVTAYSNSVSWNIKS